MKATAVQQAHPTVQPKVCEECGEFHDFPYAMEQGNKCFCKRSCWELWRKKQPPLYPMGAAHESPRPHVR